MDEVLNKSNEVLREWILRMKFEGSGLEPTFECKILFHGSAALFVRRGAWNTDHSSGERLSIHWFWKYFRNFFILLFTSSSTILLLILVNSSRISQWGRNARANSSVMMPPTVFEMWAFVTFSGVFFFVFSRLSALFLYACLTTAWDVQKTQEWIHDKFFLYYWR